MVDAIAGAAAVAGAAAPAPSPSSRPPSSTSKPGFVSLNHASAGSVGASVAQAGLLVESTSRSPASSSASSSSEQQPQQPTRPLLHIFVAGGVGGATGDFLMHSIDTVKIRIQSSHGQYEGTVDAFRKIVAEEGLIKGLYSGIGAALVGSVLSSSLYFTAYNVSKEHTLKYLPSTMAYFTSGAFGDFCASTLYVPLEVIKTRMQLQGAMQRVAGLTPRVGAPVAYQNVFHAFFTIYRREGLPGLYSGYRATVFRDMPFSAIQFTVYEQVKRLAAYLTEPDPLLIEEQKQLRRAQRQRQRQENQHQLVGLTSSSVPGLSASQLAILSNSSNDGSASSRRAASSGDRRNDPAAADGARPPVQLIPDAVEPTDPLAHPDNHYRTRFNTPTTINSLSGVMDGCISYTTDWMAGGITPSTFNTPGPSRVQQQRSLLATQDRGRMPGTSYCLDGNAVMLGDDDEVGWGPGQLLATVREAGKELLLGGFAGGVAGAITTPMDVVKTTLQSSPSAGVGVIDTFKSIYQQSGVRGLTRGMAARVIWTVPQSATMFFVFEQVTQFLARFDPDRVPAEE
ncbi:ATP-Mg/Pi carrier protein [Capsaspora owczarzaki ATCC 30864]|uniref:ATP-Mg/Pi carrier protein n=1 Tax=Capsaspora owczarzaki (strain ATCC 30864) TaxID=595528 RepID=A0A0D2VWL5_CAPO3|nr:ATP-Mg/Pi carrier protein [Capsaspora owczarzaki ATCC 30864]KJE95972.1 ATP-Mg/Pi carrier protein [Capsaspora owczarzaki ATCC 30864]|eukprot:XP_004345099.2 ATP-Mg/Pi carrier protein [Capsaspora owczarzaki ATCC 30864]